MRRKSQPAGRLRIVAGMWRSRLLPVADVDGLRPTSERVRETLFNWLGPSIHGQRCLDLYAGSGALGFEALSRGAAAVQFVDNSALAIRALRAAGVLLDAQGANVVQSDAFDYLQRSDIGNFDVVFLDPPYASAAIGELCRLLAARHCLTPRARVFVEQDRGEPLPDLPDGWSVYREKTTGNVRYALIDAARQGGDK